MDDFNSPFFQGSLSSENLNSLMIVWNPQQRTWEKVPFYALRKGMVFKTGGDASTDACFLITDENPGANNRAFIPIGLVDDIPSIPQGVTYPDMTGIPREPLEASVKNEPIFEDCVLPRSDNVSEIEARLHEWCPSTHKAMVPFIVACYQAYSRGIVKAFDADESEQSEIVKNEIASVPVPDCFDVENAKIHNFVITLNFQSNDAARKECRYCLTLDRSVVKVMITLPGVSRKMLEALGKSCELAAECFQEWAEVSI